MMCHPGKKKLSAFARERSFGCIFHLWEIPAHQSATTSHHHTKKTKRVLGEGFGRRFQNYRLEKKYKQILFRTCPLKRQFFWNSPLYLDFMTPSLQILLRVYVRQRYRNVSKFHEQNPFINLQNYLGKYLVWRPQWYKKFNKRFKGGQCVAEV